jgi:hypothetical protein
MALWLQQSVSLILRMNGPHPKPFSPRSRASKSSPLALWERARVRVSRAFRLKFSNAQQSWHWPSRHRSSLRDSPKLGAGARDLAHPARAERQPRWATGLLALMLTLMLGFGLAPRPAWAAPCRLVGAHQICVVRIKRSAKMPWEYRAQVTIDGVLQPRTVYNCRSRTRRQRGRHQPTQAFQPDGPGPMICTLTQRR